MRLFTIISCFICLMLFGLSCKKDAPSQTVYRGKVFALGCSQIGIDIEGRTGTGTGAAWTDNKGQLHTNAASISNVCYIGDLKLNPDDEVSFRISKTNVSPGSSCVLTLCLIANAPANYIYVYDMQKAN